MKNILIDTCSWINLLTDGESKLIPHLEFWKENNLINFVTHKIVVDEWNKHKKEQTKRFEESLRTKYSHAREVGKREKLLIPDILEPSIHNIENQIQIIDSILSDAVILDTSDRIKIDCSDRSISKKAPYHNKVDSTKDAYIIFSALEYFTEQKQDFLFISANKHEFGCPAELESKIHPELVESYQDIQVHYISDIGRAIDFLKKDLTVSLQTDVIGENLARYSNEIEIDKSKHILDQVYDYITARFQQINFYPISFLIDHYPFKSKGYSYYSIFNLQVDNEDVLNIFKTAQIAEDNKITITDPSFYTNVSDYLAKLQTILKLLTQNLIFSISGEMTRERINIRYDENIQCDCPMCLFRKLKFSECFKSMNRLTDSAEDLQKSSYLNYRIGNYIFSIEKQKEALAKYEKKKLKSLSFIGTFNLSKLSIFLMSNYYGENAQHNLVKELKAIDLQKAELNYSTKENKWLLNYIREHTFLTNARNKIHELSRKLIDQYYSSINGGWSSNNDAWFLVNRFAELEGFLKRNYIIYDRFNDFQDIFLVFLEGLFASHAINEPGHSRLEYFDDWLITKVIEYGNADSINKYYRRYKMKKISYRKTSSGDSFEKLIENFFSNSDLRENYSENCEGNNHSFWKYYDSVFRNIITLVSICDIDVSTLNLFTEQLINYVKIERFISAQSYRHIHTFLYRCGEQIDVNLLYKFFDLSIDNRFFHSPEFYETLQAIYEKRKIKVNIEIDQFYKLKNLSFNECSECKEVHPSSIIVFICLMIENAEHVEYIKNEILLNLTNNFSFDLFYLATILELIPLDNRLLNTAIDVSLNATKGHSLRSAFGGIDDKRYDKVNSILNLCFKFNIDTASSKKIEAYKDLDPYYDWLVDMERFDYEQFNVKWVSEYSTRFYFKKMYESTKVKEMLDNAIKTEVDRDFERNYINIFIRNTWNPDRDKTKG